MFFSSRLGPVQRHPPLATQNPPWWFASCALIATQVGSAVGLWVCGMAADTFGLSLWSWPGVQGYWRLANCALVTAASVRLTIADIAASILRLSNLRLSSQPVVALRFTLCEPSVDLSDGLRAGPPRLASSAGRAAQHGHHACWACLLGWSPTWRGERGGKNHAAPIC